MIGWPCVGDSTQLLAENSIHQYTLPPTEAVHTVIQRCGAVRHAGVRVLLKTLRGAERTVERCIDGLRCTTLRVHKGPPLQLDSALAHLPRSHKLRRCGVVETSVRHEAACDYTWLIPFTGAMGSCSREGQYLPFGGAEASADG